MSIRTKPSKAAQQRLENKSEFIEIPVARFIQLRVVANQDILQPKQEKLAGA
jgi:hypothetical protein